MSELEVREMSRSSLDEIARKYNFAPAFPAQSVNDRGRTQIRRSDRGGYLES
jgi:hypothetical protein